MDGTTVFEILPMYLSSWKSRNIFWRLSVLSCSSEALYEVEFTAKQYVKMVLIGAYRDILFCRWSSSGFHHPAYLINVYRFMPYWHIAAYMLILYQDQMS